MSDHKTDAAHRNTVEQLVLPPDCTRFRSELDEVWDEIGRALAIPARLLDVDIRSIQHTAREISLNSMRQNVSPLRRRGSVVRSRALFAQ